MKANYFKTCAVVCSLFFAPLCLAKGKLDGEDTRAARLGITLILKKNPQATYLMKCAQAEAKKTVNESLEYLEKKAKGATLAGISVTRKISGKAETSCLSEDTFIEERIKAIIDPVEKFIDALKAQEEKLRPLIEKSLGADRAPRFIKYFKASGDFKEILKEDIKSIDDLKNICEDLEMLFADIYDSLTPDAKSAYETFMSDVFGKAKASK